VHDEVPSAKTTHPAPFLAVTIMVLFAMQHDCQQNSFVFDAVVSGWRFGECLRQYQPPSNILVNRIVSYLMQQHCTVRLDIWQVLAPVSAFMQYPSVNSLAQIVVTV
jgi:hypothetical protein